MKNKEKNRVYKSFEQLQSELFPKAVERKQTEDAKKNARIFGILLANQSVDQVLSNSNH